jgi:hypothetical protein
MTNELLTTVSSAISIRRWDGKPVLVWFMKELATYHSDATERVRLEVRFNQAVTLQGDSGAQEVTRILVIAHRFATQN